MALVSERIWRQDATHDRRALPHEPAGATQTPQVVLSFDVEEHFRIEAAAGLDIDCELKSHYRQRMETCTRWLLDALEKLEIKATFFVVGEIARSHPRLVRTMSERGHEVASHSWDHQRVHNHSPANFRDDLRRSKDALEDVTGRQVFGYRAPTFSIVRETGWALDVLAEEGFAYDSSIYPIWHDRYGVPHAPRGPFRAGGIDNEILELPPATWRALRTNIPVGGGGYFRFLPLFMLEQALQQVRKNCEPPVAVLYFHPWEFDPGQERLPLGLLNRLRTYVGLNRSRDRLETLLSRHRFVRAIDVANGLSGQYEHLPSFAVWREEAMAHCIET